MSLPLPLWRNSLTGAWLSQKQNPKTGSLGRILLQADTNASACLSTIENLVGRHE